ncbi:MAG: leucine-rich repeat domain-containing protein, partial [Promethearchaeota archaeon]
MPLTPKAILEDLRNKNLDINSSIQLLLSLIENAENIDLRRESLYILDKICSNFNFKKDFIFKLFENLLISDSDEKIRTIAAHALFNSFPKRIIKLFKWILSYEKSIFVILEILQLLGKLNDSKEILQQELEKKLNEKYLYNLESIQYKNDYNTEQIANILINYFVLAHLSYKFGFLNYESKDGIVFKLNLSNIDNQGFRKIFDYIKPITYLKDLSELDLKFNQLCQIPDCISNLSSLEKLDLSYNRLKRMPYSIGLLKNLKYLGLKSNRLISIPKSVGNLINLQVLILRSNYLRSIPNTVGGLKSLKILDLHGNKIKNLPSNLYQLKNLEKLDLGRNQISEIPLWVYDRPKGKDISLRGDKV